MEAKINLAEFTSSEVKDLLKHDPIAVIPVGALEQHGPHLPLMVDWYLSSEVAKRSVRKAVEAGKHAVVLPAVWTGYSPHHMDFPGTITLSADTFQRLLIDIAKSLNQHGFRHIFFLNGHGGNINLLRSTVQALRFEHGVQASGASYWDFATESISRWRTSPLGGINHACEMETSLMMALRDDLVDRESIVDHIPPASKYRSFDLTMGGFVADPRPFAELAPTGVLGAPSLADGQRGHELLEEISEAVKEFLCDFYL